MTLCCTSDGTPKHTHTQLDLRVGCGAFLQLGLAMCVSATLPTVMQSLRGRLKCDGTRAETRFLLSAKRTSPFKSEGPSVRSTTGSRILRISDSNAGYTMFRGCVKGTGYPLHSPVSPSLPLPYVTVCHHISTGVYNFSYPLSTLLNNTQLQQ